MSERLWKEIWKGLSTKPANKKTLFCSFIAQSYKQKCRFSSETTSRLFKDSCFAQTCVSSRFCTLI